jgi:HCOMODA/2-hydroxy-3-carboxy-muconic semialdehyde decarboxylase
VFRSVYSARNAEYQVRAMTVGSTIALLSPGETKLAGQISAKTTGLTRSWEYWSMRVAKAGGSAGAPKQTPAGGGKAKSVKAKTKAKKIAKKKAAPRRAAKRGRR